MAPRRKPAKLIPHDHTTVVPGCFRCDISKDEVRCDRPWDECDDVLAERNRLRAELAACERERLKSHREANEWCEKTLSALRELDEARAGLTEEHEYWMRYSEQASSDLRRANEDAARLAAVAERWLVLAAHWAGESKNWDETRAALAAHEARVKGGAP